MVNFAFTIIQDENCTSFYGHHTFGIGEIKENYEDFSEPMQLFMDAIQNLKSISFENKTIDLEYYFAADYKILLIVLGLKGANGNYPCLYCLSHKNKFHLIEHSDARKMCDFELHPGKKIDFGFLNQSLIPESIIPLKNIIICTLHLRMRIFEVLLKKLIKDICD